MSKKSFSVLRQINLHDCVFSMKKGNWLHPDLNLQPVASQADALSITPQGPLYKYVKINILYIVCSFFYYANIQFFGNKLNNLNK